MHTAVFHAEPWTSPGAQAPRLSLHRRTRFFARAFAELFGDAPESDAKAVLNAAFDLFDDNNDGLVDGAELAAGLGSLCGGRHDVKVRLCFDLFDADNDGYLDEWEVRRYLRSVYRTAPGQDLLDEDGERVRPEDLAAATASISSASRAAP